MTAYFRCSGAVGSELVTEMNAAFNEVFESSSVNYPVKEWADDTNLLGPIPIRTKSGTNSVSFSDSLAMPLVSLKATLANRVNTTELSAIRVMIRHGAELRSCVQSLNTPIVGGELDFLSGAVTHPYIRGPITTNKLITQSENASGLIYISWAWTSGSTKAEGVTNIRSNLFTTSQTRIQQDASVEGISGSDTGVGMYIAILASRLTGDLTTNEGRIAAFRQWATDNGLVVDYEARAQGTTVTFEPLTNEQADPITGLNEYYEAESGVWDSCEVSYYLDIND